MKSVNGWAELEPGDFISDWECKWMVNSGDTLSLVDYNGTTQSDVLLTWCIGCGDGVARDVVRVGPSAFAYHKEIQHVGYILPGAVKEIGDTAFYRCTHLCEAILPDTLETLGDRVFAYCGLKSISLPDSLTEMGIEVFLDCHQLEEVKLPPHLKIIGPGVFENCSALREIDVPEGVEYIYANAFAGCENLSVILRGKNTKVLGEYSRQCPNVQFIFQPLESGGRQLGVFGIS